MNICELFEQRSGIWLSQCTTQDLVTKQSTNLRAQITVEQLTPHSLKIVSGKEITTVTATPGTEGELMLQVGANSIAGKFEISDDKVLTLTATLGELTIVEKLWFPLPNLCMRTGMTTGAIHQAKFWTEVRKLPTATTS